MVVNGGLRQGQTSTALMVLLLSTALFLIPGFRDQVSITVLLHLATLVIQKSCNHLAIVFY